MSRVDYYSATTAIKEVLAADTTLAGVSFFVEQEVMFSDSVPAVYIYLNNRELSEDQRLSAATRVDYLCFFSLWCIDGAFDSMEESARHRDDLLGLVETALMKDPTLGGAVDMSWLEGGEFMSAADEDIGFFAAAEIQLTAKVHGTTV